MRRTAAQLQQQLDDDLRCVLATPPGRRFLWRLMTQSGLSSASYADTDRATARNEGRRAVAIALEAEVRRVSPSLYVQAMREQADELEREAHAVIEEPDEDDDG